MNVQKIRKDFPILARKINGKPMVYLDSAATSQKPKQVIDAVEKFLKTSNSNVHRGIHTLTIEATEALDHAREKIADFVGVKDVGEIIFVRNTTEAINLVAYSWGRLNISKGDEIVLTIAEHHSNFVPWQQLAAENGAILKIVPVTKNGEIDEIVFKNALTKKTKLATFFHVSNILGTIAPVQRLTLVARRLAPQAVVLVDGAQAVPHLPVNISKIGCDFYAFSGHKMLGSAGIGVLWGRREILEAMPPFMFGGDMISTVKIEKTQWAELPLKFEAGTPNIEGAIGLGAAVDYLRRLGMENVRCYEQELTKYALEKLSKIEEVEVFGPKEVSKRCGVISFRIRGSSRQDSNNNILRANPSIPLRPSALRLRLEEINSVSREVSALYIPAHDIASILDSEGVEIRSGFNCAEPLADFLGIGPTARASFYIYNTQEDVDRLVLGLRRVQEVFGSVGKWDSRRKNKNNNLQTHHPTLLHT